MSATATALADRLEGARARTRELLAPLSAEDMARQHSPLLSPPLWDLGHIAAYEELWLVRRLTGAPSLHPELEDVYDAIETPRATRSEAPILDEPAARRYLDDVRARALDALAAGRPRGRRRPPDGPGFVFDMVAQHEAAAHRDGPAVPPDAAGRRATRRPGAGRCPRAAGRPAGWVEVPGGAFPMGAPGGGFAYDCERPLHRREVAPFEIARDPVTCGEHLAFMADGGYRRRELWTAAGWEWREREGAEAPLYWERDGEGGWLVRSFERRAPVDPEGVLCHVSAHEADAHAAWAGARLPTEAEWELAAQGAAADAEAANLDQLAFGPAGRGAYGRRRAAAGA